MRPTEAESTPRPSLIKFRTGAKIDPAIMVKMAEANIIHRVNLLKIFIVTRHHN
jgi:hypothetical protein